MVCIEELLNVQRRYREYTTILGAMRYTYRKMLCSQCYQSAPWCQETM